MYLSEELQNKWQPVLEHPELSEIQDPYKKAVTTVVLENQEKALREEKEALFEAPHANQTGAGVDNYDPILISLVRRALPNLMAYDVCGVQPMSGPTGLIFAMKSHYTSQTGTEALFNEADTDFSGAGTHAGANPVDGSYTTGTGVSTSTAEGFGDSTTLNEMAFSIEKTTVTAKSRALKAQYTVELAQDLKAVHGLDAESELSNILSQENKNFGHEELIPDAEKNDFGLYGLGQISMENGAALIGVRYDSRSITSERGSADFSNFNGSFGIKRDCGKKLPSLNVPSEYSRVWI